MKVQVTNKTMKLIAHIIDKNGMRMEQSLSEHCIKTAKYAAESLQNIGFFHMAYLAGLLHDMGKATNKYNNYLEDSFMGKKVIRGSVNHTFAGVIYLFDNYHNKEDSAENQLVTEIISYAIGGHHGLFDCVDFDGKNGFMHRLNKDREEICYEEAKNNFFEKVTSQKKIQELYDNSLQEFSTFFNKLKIEYAGKSSMTFFQLSLFARLLLAAVIYGDRRDTVEFMKDLTFHNSVPIDWKSEKLYFEHQLARFSVKSDMNQIRTIISEQCLSFAERPTGIYRLNVPTGAGKTLSTLRYALAHAEKYHKKKIIFIIPLLSVLDQNVKVIREYVQNQKIVMEHHSNVIIEQESENLDLYEVLTENWDSPIIVSTLVQFLNILFVHKTSMINRMRALCDSVIIIDEVQSIPKKTIAMFNMAINFLSSYCNATIVLSSATQPCFEELEWNMNFSVNPDMVTLTQQQLQIFERADIIDNTNPYGMDFDELIDFCCSIMEEQESLLVITNTKSEAQNLFHRMKELANANKWCVYHLSTAMCKSHRTDILEEIQRKLYKLQKCVQNGKKNTEQNADKIICISTQLVEAGIDFSFECVVRVMAGIDNLAQAAGRCNRSNEYGHKGKVYLINLKNENLNMLKEIYAAQNSTQNILFSMKQTDNESLIGENATQKFYHNMFLQNDMKRQMKYPITDCQSELFLVDLLANKNPYARDDTFTFFHQPFKIIGKNFRVFDEQTIDILVPYNEGISLIEELGKIEQTHSFVTSLEKTLKQTKNYTISIYQWQFDKLLEKGLLYSMFENRIFILDKKAYHNQYGLNSKAEHNVEDFIL